MFSVVGRPPRRTLTKTMAFHRAEPRGRERHRPEARRVKLAGASESNALQLFSKRFSPLPPTPARCYAMELATRFWCKGRKRRDKRSVCRTTFYRQRVHAFSKLITWPVPPAD